MFISFLGTLPLGTLNISAMQIAVSDGILQGFYFAAGAIWVEMVYVRLSLVAMDWVRKRKKLFFILEWVTLGIILLLAIASFYTALHPEVHKNPVLSHSLPRFWLGTIMSAVNPMQIPFWFGWSTVLFTRKVLVPGAWQFNSYISGIGLGTLSGNAVFILGGKLLVEKLNTNEQMIHWIVGGIFALTALIQLWKMLSHKDGLAKLDKEVPPA